MPLILGALAVLVLLAGVAVALGFILPVKHYAARSAVYRQPVDTVWALITTPADYPQWRKDVKAVEVLDADPARLRWRETGGERPLTFQVRKVEPYARWVTRIMDEGLPFGGGWVFILAPEPGGCRLTIREEGEIYNRFFRVMARFVFGYHRALEAYLVAVGAKFGETVRPEPAPTWG